ncbi:sensor histidine kinase [soil metagenome]
MPLSTNLVSDFLRAEVALISRAWETAVRQRLAALEPLERGALIDHVPEFLIGLAAWIDGNEESASKAFMMLVEGHALQRLGFGIPLEVVSTEYQILRTVILTSMLSMEASKETRPFLIRMHQGLDLASAQAIHAYAARRDVIRERFIGILGHDLRNPLNAILLGASAIGSTECSQPKHDSISATMQRSALRMQLMIADVMDFAHAHLGEGIPAVPIPCDLGAIAREAVHELATVHPGRAIAVETRGDLAGHWDRDRVLQALSNLVANAVQHGNDPISVEVLERADKLAVTTRVSSTGTTIPREMLAQLF